MMEVDQISERDAHSLDSVADRYVVRSILGRGASATVFLAEDRKDQRPVVLKLLSEGAGSDGDEALARFHAEVAAMRQLEHKNIVQVLGDGVTSDNRPYLVTGWIGGRSLAAVLREVGRLATRDAIDVGVAIAEALAYVHSRGLVHRDLKPSNVLIPGWPDAPDYKSSRLLDFGVAGRLEQGHTRVGMIFGTLRYMSPEQIKAQAQSAATDVYGFGLLLFEMLVGHAPANRERDLTTLVIAIRDGISPQDLEGVEPDLADLISRCVRQDPQERPSMTEVLKELAASPHRLVVAGSDPFAGLIPVAFDLPTAAAPAPAPAAKPSSPAQKVTGTTVAWRTKAASAAPSVPPVSEPEFVAPRGSRRLLWIALPGAAVISAAIVMFYLRTYGNAPNEAASRGLRFAGGLLLTGASIAVGLWLRNWLGSRSQVKSEAYELVFGAKARTDLTATIAVQLDELVSKLRKLDERILAGTVALMLEEYGSATDTKDRQAALMNVVALSEKLAVRLSPWYERYKEIIASAVAVMGGVSGLVTALNSVLAHRH
jgi:hypothetical protein